MMWWKRWHRWRWWHYHHKHHHHKNNFFAYLKVDNMSGSISVVFGDGLAHKAVLTCLNLDGSAAQNVAITYSSDNPSTCTVDAASGNLTLVGAGNANITGTGVRGTFSHSDSVSVTVTVDVNTGDFTVSLAVS